MLIRVEFAVLLILTLAALLWPLVGYVASGPGGQEQIKDIFVR